jgi:hypothetical protein
MEEFVADAEPEQEASVDLQQWEEEDDDNDLD